MADRPSFILLVLALAAVLFSCKAESSDAGRTRDTLPKGALLVRHPRLPAIDSVGPEVTESRVDLRFGSADGSDPNLTFGNILGVQPASDGTIYVLDQQGHVPFGREPGLPAPAGTEFEAFEMVVVNPSGGFWRAHNTSYRIARTGESGDTLAVIEAGRERGQASGPSRAVIPTLSPPPDGVFCRSG